METRSEMARLWLYGNHEISSKVKYYLILRYGRAGYGAIGTGA